VGATAGPVWLTRGQPTALAAVARMVSGRPPHAVLLVGPAAVGKTTLADDLAAGLLCIAADRSDRPCRACRACRMVANGNHPDVHRLGPEGPGGQIVIGGSREANAPRGVRDLVRELAFLPIEGGARVAVVEAADQMNEDAQHALLKTLEEPPAGVTIILCADREGPLLPTVRSRCARIRLGPLSVRDIEALLGELGLADPFDAARFARLAEGRPGLAFAFARAPEAAAIRDEIARTLLDLLAAGRSRRLAAARELLGRSRDLAEALGPPAPPAEPTKGRSKPPADPGEPSDPFDATTAKVSPAERRRAARQLLTVWRQVARDLAVVRMGGRAAVNDVVLLEEMEAAASRLPVDASATFLVRLDEIAELLAGNVSPELALDVLVLAWPSTERAAA
jgi:DNA polymerase III subunit delta'